MHLSNSYSSFPQIIKLNRRSSYIVHDNKIFTRNEYSQSDNFAPIKAKNVKRAKGR